MLALVARAELQQLLERHHLLVLEGVQPLHVEHDDLHELRAVRADLEDLVELLFVLGEEEAVPLSLTMYSTCRGESVV